MSDPANSAIRDIKKEKNQLERNNDNLADKIATTHALQAYYNELKLRNKLLRNQSHHHQPGEQQDLDKLYDAEIQKLKEDLDTCQATEKKLQYELKEAVTDKLNAEDLHSKTKREVEYLENEAAKAREAASKASDKLSSLNYEVEELEKVKKFNEEVHAAELENLRRLVGRVRSNSNSSASHSSMTYPEEIDIQKMLDDFRKEYEEILKRVYEQERDELLKDIAALEAQKAHLDSENAKRQKAIADYQRDIARLNEELAMLEKQGRDLRRQGEEEQKHFEEHRDQVLANIEKAEKRKTELEKELRRLEEEDDETMKLIIQLQLEINAYRALIEAEQSNFDSSEFDHQRKVEIPISELTR